jgi:hypothetical protein
MFFLKMGSVDKASWGQRALAFWFLKYQLLTVFKILEQPTQNAEQFSS